jgi:hypothetical protein
LCYQNQLRAARRTWARVHPRHAMASTAGAFAEPRRDLVARGLSVPEKKILLVCLRYVSLHRWVPRLAGATLAAVCMRREATTEVVPQGAHGGRAGRHVHNRCRHGSGPADRQHGTIHQSRNSVLRSSLSCPWHVPRVSHLILGGLGALGHISASGYRRARPRFLALFTTLTRQEHESAFMDSSLGGGVEKLIENNRCAFAASTAPRSLVCHWTSCAA